MRLRAIGDLLGSLLDLLMIFLEIYSLYNWISLFKITLISEKIVE